MKVSDDLKDAYSSSGGIVAISILVILVLFAIFTSSGKGGSIFNRTGGTMEDIREQRMEQQENQMESPRNFTVKDGQNLVIF